MYVSMESTGRPQRWLQGAVSVFRQGRALQPFRLLQQDLANLPKRYVSDWTTFNQLIFASAVYVFFTNLLPGITFASDLFNLTNANWGTIEVVFSTGLCGLVFSLYVCCIYPPYWVRERRRASLGKTDRRALGSPLSL